MHSNMLFNLTMSTGLFYSVKEWQSILKLHAESLAK